MTPSKDTLIKS